MKKKVIETKTWVITFNGASFIMTDPTGETTLGDKPNRLADKAWNHGADAVKHDYDLSLVNGY